MDEQFKQQTHTNRFSQSDLPDDINSVGCQTIPELTIKSKSFQTKSKSLNHLRQISSPPKSILSPQSPKSILQPQSPRSIIQPQQPQQTQQSLQPQSPKSIILPTSKRINTETYLKKTFSNAYFANPDNVKTVDDELIQYPICRRNNKVKEILSLQRSPKTVKILNLRSQSEKIKNKKENYSPQPQEFAKTNIQQANCFESYSRNIQKLSLRNYYPDNYANRPPRDPNVKKEILKLRNRQKDLKTQNLLFKPLLTSSVLQDSNKNSIQQYKMNSQNALDQDYAEYQKVLMSKSNSNIFSENHNCDLKPMNYSNQQKDIYANTTKQTKKSKQSYERNAETQRILKKYLPDKNIFQRDENIFMNEQLKNMLQQTKINEKPPKCKKNKKVGKLSFDKNNIMDKENNPHLANENFSNPNIKLEDQDFQLKLQKYTKHVKNKNTLSKNLKDIKKSRIW